MAESSDNTVNMSKEDKQVLMAERLQKRDDFRKSEIQKKKDDNESTTREKCEYFHETLNKVVEDVETQLALTSSMRKDDLIDHFDGITVKIQTANKFLSESTLFLPSYDISRASEILVKLELSMQEKRTEFLPKKKFAFKSRKANEKDVKEKKIQQPQKDEVDRMSNSKDPAALAACKFVKEENKKLVKQPEDINLKDVALSELKSCTVQFYGSPSAVHMNKLKDCKIFCGPVSGSIFINDCDNCTFVLSCQQLRIHRTSSSHFYIHVTCKAIIEDCSGIKFAPYNWTYPSIEEHFKISGLEKERNKWDDIDDFNWLAADAHSPNWSILKVSDRITTWPIS